MNRTEKGLHKEYLRNCKGIRVLKTLDKKRLSPRAKVEWLEQKLRAVPRLVRGHKKALAWVTAHQQGRISHSELVRKIREVLEEFPELRAFPFPRGYWASSVKAERAKVLCELSQARWEFFMLERYGKIPGRRTLKR